MDYQDKLIELAKLIETQTREVFAGRGFTSPVHEPSFIITVIPGKKYTKVDVGRSGKYMVDAEGKIFGIKAYGQIHRGHQYGTLDTIHNYYWGGFVAKPIKNGGE